MPVPESFLLDYPAVMPLLVFLAEVTVVTIGTIRIIFVSRGKRLLAPFLGFFEVTIWLLAMVQIMKNLSNVGCFLGYVGGFTVGTLLGILIENKLAIGSLFVRVVTNKDAGALVESLKAANYGVTSMDGQGTTGPVQIVFTVIKRKDLHNVLTIVKCFDPRAFYSVDELQAASQGDTETKQASSLLVRIWR